MVTRLVHGGAIVGREEDDWFGLTDLAMCWEVKEGIREGLVILIRLVIDEGTREFHQVLRCVLYAPCLEYCGGL